MTRISPALPRARWWAAACATLVLCSCRGNPLSPQAAAPAARADYNLPESSASAPPPGGVRRVVHEESGQASGIREQGLGAREQQTGASGPQSVSQADHVVLADEPEAELPPVIEAPAPRIAPQQIARRQQPVAEPTIVGAPEAGPLSGDGPVIMGQDIVTGEEIVVGGDRALPWSPPGTCPDCDLPLGAVPRVDLPGVAEYSLQPVCGCTAPLRFHADDEYICDGGDTELEVRVHKDWSVFGIDQTDTVGHYDTVDGRTIVEPSNRVCIYSPRFGAVRQIIGPVINAAEERAIGVDRDQLPISQERTAITGALDLPLQPGRHHGLKSPNAFREDSLGLLAENSERAEGAHLGLRPYEDFEFIRNGINISTEKARLNERVEAALVWMTWQAPQVIIDQEKALPVTGGATSQEFTHYELGGKPRLRICKIASTDNAQSGDTVEFTIRFDNVGSQKIGNVTIIDSLVARLEYVEDSQQCSLKANFLTQRNDGDSLVLRWEIVDPLDHGEGGVIRFKCKVR